MLAIQEAFNKGYRVRHDGVVTSPKGKVLKLQPFNKIYLSFGIRFKKKPRRIPVHRFVAFTKYGLIALTSDCVRHLDGNSKNNSFDNIEIGTNSDNMFDVPYSVRRKRSIIGSHKQWMKWDDSEVPKIKKFYTETRSYKKTMDKFGILSKSTLHNILHNR